jgi:hypothetical protein
MGSTMWRGRGLKLVWVSSPAFGYDRLHLITRVRASGARTSSMIGCGTVPEMPNEGSLYTVWANTKSAAESGRPSCQVRLGRNR